MSDTSPPSAHLEQSHNAPVPPATRRKRRPWLWIAVLILIGVGGFIFWRHHNQAGAGTAATHGRGGFGSPVIMVSTVKAQTGDIGIYVNALGVVTPLNTVSVVSRVQGEILKVNYQEGQMVHAGDSLVEIDPGPDQAALDQAIAKQNQDQAQLNLQQVELKREAALIAAKIDSQDAYDQVAAQVEELEATVKSDAAAVASARVQLAFCHITAPISGRVGLRLVDAGNMVQASGTTPLVVITELQPIGVIFNVSEDDLPPILKQLHVGHTLAVDAFDREQTKKIATGTLKTLDNQIDPTTGTLKFKAVFTNDDESLFPNQFVNARLLVNTLTNVTLLPNIAIQRNAESAFVYVIKPVETGTNQTVAMQTITIGTTDGNVSSVSGIEPSTEVVTENFNKLTDGAKVTLRPAAGAAGAAGAPGTPGTPGKGGGHKKSSS
jgi:multidrug efflux system membrane fusion protein